MLKRRKLEFTITLILYLGSAVLSGVIAFFLLRGSKLTAEFLAGNFIANALLPLVFSEFISIYITQYDGKYSFSRISIWRSIWKALGGTFVLAGIWAVILLIMKNTITESRYFFVGTLGTHFVLLSAGLYCIQNYTIEHFYKTRSASHVLLVTTRARAAMLSDLMKKDWYRKLSGIALIDEAVEQEGSGARPEEIDHIPVVAGKNNFIPWVQQNALDEVYLVVENNEAPEIVAAVQNFLRMGISVHLSLPSLEKLGRRLGLEEGEYSPRIQRRLGYISGQIPMVIMDHPEPKLRYLMLKRCMDIAGGLVGSAIALLLFVFVGLAIRLDSPGPVIFAQERVGRNGRKFRMYKFRSMYRDAEQRKAALMAQNEMDGLMFKMKDDPRITRVGRFIRKTSLDEFPQFFNVLKGDMSLIGTRPPTVGEFQQYSNYHKRRLSMKPGITGMWQVSGRSDISDFEEVVRMDCYYIDNWSLWLDIKILFKTVLIVFRGSGSR